MSKGVEAWVAPHTVLGGGHSHTVREEARALGRAASAALRIFITQLAGLWLGNE